MPGKKYIRVLAKEGFVGFVPPRPLKSYVHVRGTGPQLIRHDVPQTVSGKDGYRPAVPAYPLMDAGVTAHVRCGQQPGLNDRSRWLPARLNC